MSTRLGGRGGVTPPLLAALLGLALLVAAPRPSTADAPAAPRPADPGEVDDVLDLLYLAPARPFLFRLHVTIDGKPYTARWAERVLAVFKYLDKANDGFLTSEEVALAPTPQQLAQMFHGVPYGTAAFNDPEVFKAMDADEDGKVTPAEFLNYYRHSAGGPAQLVGAPATGLGANTLTETLFKVLDTDKDGKLSKKELMAAERVLHKYDQNDDEVITIGELLQAPVAFAAGGPAMMQGPYARPTALVDSPFVLVPREEAPKRITERLAVAKDLIARYDKDNDGKLSLSEIGLPKEVFDRYDADKDGAWNALEVVRWMVFAPDLEATVRLGRVGDRDGLLDLASPGGAAAAGGLAVHKAAVNAVSLGMNDALISLIRAPQASDYGGLTDNVFQGYDQQFQMADKDDKRYITRKELAEGNNPALYQAFPIIDRDGDGRVTEEELRAWVALATESAGCVPAVSVADNGRALFEMLDVNNDGRLTLRELRGAWARLAPYDHDGDGAISREEIPQQFQLTVLEAGVDPNVFQQQLAQQQAPVAQPQPPRIERGPLWFRKMDVNGDGDVSPREFLGSLEDFKRIDTDGDGLISVEEAEAFDAMMRAKKGEK